MRHLKALGIKFVITSIVLFSILPIFLTAGLGEILFMSILLTGIAYLIGDLFLLSRFGYFIAAAADFALVTLSVWILSIVFIGNGPSILAAALSTGFGIAISEAIFHIYMKEKVLTDTEDHLGNFRRMQMQTEIAEEENIHDLKRKPKKNKHN
ncbi:YndM family protein [Oceanobacillus damuensis]|uniref:YndM family protein n=1 Tax=Oceanobacillus damuensis TaxID=937928 RepID=UPI00082A3A66|nr:YndM family protein [Oceanobacillus damuensis]